MDNDSGYETGSQHATTAVRRVPWPVRAAVGLPLGLLAIGLAGVARVLGAGAEVLIGDLK